MALVEIARKVYHRLAATKRTIVFYNQHGAVKVSKESHVTTEFVNSGMATIGKNITSDERADGRKE